jgi:hypothetical protein
MALALTAAVLSSIMVDARPTDKKLKKNFYEISKNYAMRLVAKYLFFNA